MLRLRDVTIAIGGFCLDRVAFEVAEGSYTTLMGPTGCGKTTLLEALCGLREIEHGDILLDGQSILNAPVATRGIGYVPQDGALFGRMTVRENIAFSARIRGAARRVWYSESQQLASQLGVAHLLDRRAAKLSGGETQRVALARAIAAEPRLLLLDEPLSALDEQTRLEIRGLLKQVQSETGVTTLHVTHSSEEARHLADRRLEIVGGRVVEQAQPSSEDSASQTQTDPRTTAAI